MKKLDIKLVVCDLDNTLLLSNKQLSDNTRTALKQLCEKGIPFAIASGRPIELILLKIKEWRIADLVDHIIYANGYGCYHTKTKLSSHSYPAQCRWIKEILDEYADLDLVPIYFDGYTLKAPRSNCATDRISFQNGNELELVDFSFFTSFDPPKIMVSGTPSTIDALEKREALLHRGEFHGFRSAPDLFEYADIRVGKGNAVKALCQTLAISPEHALVFGDSGNDLDMLCAFSHSVAMGNAASFIKEKARYVARSNDEDGVAHFLWEHVL